MIKEYLTELKINGKSKNTISTLESVLKEANEYKQIPEWSKDDVNTFILSLQEKNKKSSVELKKAVLKKFFIWAGKEQIVKHLKIKFPKTSLKREDILTVEEINKLIESIESPMYKAMIAFLFESGGRISEVLPILVGEVKETDKGMIIPVHATKTGEEYRPVLCLFSAQYIRNHITYHGLSKEDNLFPVKRPAAHVMLQKIAKKAGITKPISPHKFRHAQAVDMLRRGYQDQITKKKLGWKEDSKMISRYTHVIDDDVINATLEKSGGIIHRETIPFMKQAEPLKIADATATIIKQGEDIKELQEQLMRVTTLLKESIPTEYLKKLPVNNV